MFPVTTFMEETVADISGTGWITGLTSSSFAGVLNGCMQLVPRLVTTAVGIPVFHQPSSLHNSTTTVDTRSG